MLNQIERLVTEYERGKLSRRTLLAQLGALVTVAGLGRPALAADEKTPTFKALGLNHIALDVTNVPRARDFYQRHLGLTMRSDGGERNCFLDCGDHFVALFKADKPAMNHYCYSIRGYDAANAVERLKAAGLTPRRADNRVYFDDPDGLECQVAEMP
jgi:catechol 2,3-dioxygenase-like lactoylglutathione lyase family enzyme